MPFHDILHQLLLISQRSDFCFSEVQLPPAQVCRSVGRLDSGPSMLISEHLLYVCTYPYSPSLAFLLFVNFSNFSNFFCNTKQRISRRLKLEKEQSFLGIMENYLVFFCIAFSASQLLHRLLISRIITFYN